MRRLPWVLVAIGVLGIGWCLSDAYRARTAFFHMGRLTTPADLDWSPAERPPWHVVDPPGALAPYAPMAKEVAGEGSTRERAMRLLAYVAALGGDAEEASRKDVPITQADDVAVIMESVRSERFRGNCAHYSAILHTLVNAAGLDARLVALEGPRYNDASGHALNEVWLPEEQTWMVLDPLFHAVFLDADGRPLSLRRLRDLLLADRGDEVQVVQGDVRARDKNGAELLAYYREEIDRIMLPGGNDLLAGRAAVYDSWLAKALRLESWPRLPRRAMENTFWSLDHRYIYADRPEYDDDFTPFYVWRASWVLVFAGGAWLLLRALLGRGPRAGRSGRSVAAST